MNAEMEDLKARLEEAVGLRDEAIAREGRRGELAR